MGLEIVKKDFDGDQIVIDKLKEDGKPILVYGSANHAELVYEFLINYGLCIEAFIVDSKYFQKKCFIKEIEIKDITDYTDKIEQYSVVIGFCDIEKTKLLINNPQLLKTKFYLLWEPFEAYEWNEEYLRTNSRMLNEVYDNLADTRSREVLNRLIYAKMNSYGKELLKVADSDQYFNNLTFCLNSKNEIFVDCGAYNGDTILKYIEFSNGEYEKIYAFEPNEINLKELRNKIKKFTNIEIIDKGTWTNKGILEFEENGSASQIVCGGKTKIPVISIDEIVKNEKVTFIKMDVEGSELESLQGATHTIMHNMPKLAICCYHKADDIINIYQFIKQFNNDKICYRFYLRHHSNSVYETVFYAIPEKIEETV